MLFTLSTTNGQSGTLAADLPFDYASTVGYRFVHDALHRHHDQELTTKT